MLRLLSRVAVRRRCLVEFVGRPSCSRQLSSGGGAAVAAVEGEGEEAAKDDWRSMAAFFDEEEVWGKGELKAEHRCGRSWQPDDLTHKSSEDLHKLWYVLVKERNKLLTMEHACKWQMEAWANPERLDRVEESMESVEEVVRQRNAAVLQLETGATGQRPHRSVTTVLGFRHNQPATEHLVPGDADTKGYEEPDLDEDRWVFQKLWKEKQWYKRWHEQTDRLKDEGKLRRTYTTHNPFKTPTGTGNATR